MRPYLGIPSDVVFLLSTAWIFTLFKLDRIKIVRLSMVRYRMALLFKAIKSLRFQPKTIFSMKNSNLYKNTGCEGYR